MNLKPEVRPLPDPAEKAYPPDLAALWKRFTEDVKFPLPIGMTGVSVSNVQPTDTKLVWFRLTTAGNFDATLVFTQGAWRRVGLFKGMMLWVEGRPDKFENGKDGWFIADGENGTIDMRSSWQYFEGVANAERQTFGSFRTKLVSLLNDYQAIAGATFDDLDGVMDNLLTWLKNEDECGCKDEKDPANVKAFIIVWKGLAE